MLLRLPRSCASRCRPPPPCPHVLFINTCVPCVPRSPLQREGAAAAGQPIGEPASSQQDRHQTAVLLCTCCVACTTVCLFTQENPGSTGAWFHTLVKGHRGKHLLHLRVGPNVKHQQRKARASLPQTQQDYIARQHRHRRPSSPSLRRRVAQKD